MVCIEHCSPNDLQLNRKQPSLKKFAIPTIFETDDEFGRDEYECIEYLGNDDSNADNNNGEQHDDRNGIAIVRDNNLVDACVECNQYKKHVQTLINRCSELEENLIQNSTTMNQTIRCQSAEISKLEQTNHDQLKKISSLEERITDYEKKMKSNDQIMQSPLIQFAINANDPKVICTSLKLFCFSSSLTKNVFIFTNISGVKTEGNFVMPSSRHSTRRIVSKTCSKFLSWTE